MKKKPIAKIEQSGRVIKIQEIEEIISTVGAFPALSYRELIETVCEHLQWYTATGRNKRDACMKLLQKLEGLNLLKLPAKQKRSPNRVVKTRTDVSRQVEELSDQEICCDLQSIKPIIVEPITTKSEIEIWNECVSQYHYLGYHHPFGCFLRYFAKTIKGEILACALFSGAAKSLENRDQWIGWNRKQRLRNLPWVVNNSRFAIMPWVKVRCLASHILGQIGRRVVKDWQNQWGYSPLLMETFVDPLKYSGISYKASNWICLGQTKGTGLVRPGKEYTTSPKLIFVRSLSKTFREKLCSEYLEGRIDL